MMQLKTRRMRKSRGFTLLELMIAMTVLSFGMLGVAATQINAMRGARSGKNLSAAVEVAQMEMERLIRVSWTDLTVVAWTTPTKAVSQVDSSVEVLDQDYMVSRRVAEPVAGMIRSIDVEVSWDDSSTGNRSYAVTTLRFNDGS